MGEHKRELISIDEAIKRVGVAIFGAEWIGALSENEKFLIRRFVDGSWQREKASIWPGQISYQAPGWADYPSNPKTLNEAGKARVKQEQAQEQQSSAKDWLESHGFNVDAQFVDRRKLDCQLKDSDFQSDEKRAKPETVDDPMQEPKWTLAVALAWIIWRSPKTLSEPMALVPMEGEVFSTIDKTPPLMMHPAQLLACAVEDKETGRQILAPDAAIDELQLSLEEGKLTAVGVLWEAAIQLRQRDKIRIHKDKWLNLSLRTDPIMFFHSVCNERRDWPRYRNVYVKRDDVFKLWPKTEQSEVGGLSDIRDIAQKLINFRMVSTEIYRARWNGETTPLPDILSKFGFNSEGDFWATAMSEPMPTLSFVHLLRDCLIPSNFWQTPTQPRSWSEEVERIERSLHGALALAFDDENKSWIKPKGKELWLDPRKAAEWLLSKPMRVDLVPLGLRALLERPSNSKPQGESGSPTETSVKKQGFDLESQLAHSSRDANSCRLRKRKEARIENLRLRLSEDKSYVQIRHLVDHLCERDGPEYANRGKAYNKIATSILDDEFRFNGRVRIFCIHQDMFLRMTPFVFGKRFDPELGADPEECINECWTTRAVIAQWCELHSMPLMPRLRDDCVKQDAVSALLVVEPALKGKGGKAARRGRLPKLDWGVIEDLIKIKIGESGVPNLDNEIGWRCQADVERYALDCLQERNETAEESTIRKHVSQILNKLKAEAGK